MARWRAKKHEKETIKRMASAGMTTKMVATALGISSKTLQNSKSDIKLFHEAQTDAITKVGECALQRAMMGTADTALLCFILKTRGGWRETETFITLDHYCTDEKGFDTTTEQKIRMIDQEFADGGLSINNYKILNDALAMRSKLDLIISDIDNRLKELEST